MDMMNLIYYVAGGCIVILLLVAASNFLVNVLIRQVTDRALQQFQHRLSQDVAKALEAFKEGVCEQMVMQERRTDTLAKLYSSLIDITREGKAFAASMSGEPELVQRKLLTFEEITRAFCEEYKKQSLHFSRDFKSFMDTFIVELEAASLFMVTKWQDGRNDTGEKYEITKEQIRQAWAKAEDRIVGVMNVMRDEFRKRVQAPESIMKKWFNEVAAPKSPSASSPDAPAEQKEKHQSAA